MNVEREKKLQKRRMKRFARAVKTGVCAWCEGRAVPGLSLCKECKEGSKADPNKARRKARAKRLDHKMRGLCINCTEKPMPGRTRCERHLLYAQEWAKKRFETGKCRWCNEPTVDGTQLCRDHREKSRAYKRGYGKFFNARHKAKQRGIRWDLSRGLYDVLMQGCCEYCRFPLENYGTSLDRKDSKKGYIKDNVVPCCIICNEAKSDKLSYEQMMMFVGPAIREARLWDLHGQALEENVARQKKAST